MKIVCIGDSLTNGRDWRPGTELYQPLNVRLAVKYPRIEFVNLGVNGDTTTGILARKSDVNIYHPFGVILMAGINDIMWGQSFETIMNNLQTLYDYYSGLGYKVYALTITPRDDDNDSQNEIRNKVNQWIMNKPIGVSMVINAFLAIADPNDKTKRNPVYADPFTTNHFNDAGLAQIVNLL